MSLGAIVLALAWIGAVLGPVLAVAGWLRLAPKGRRSAPVLIGLALFTLAYGLAVWAFLVEPTTLVVRHVAVESAGWRGPPVRIAVLSDTHQGPHVSVARLRKVAAMISSERADLAVFLGDYAGGHRLASDRSTAERARIIAGVTALGEVRAPLGRVAVLGNHDWWYDGPAIRAALEQAGVAVLENDAVRVARPGAPFWVAGLADMDSERADAHRAEPSPMRALRKVPPGEPVIMLTHPPDPWPEVSSQVALTLAGHSHCGQVNLPLVGPPWLPSPGSRRWPCGLYEDGPRRLYVTGGLGVSILPLRFRAPPEIVILTLSAPPQPLPSAP